MLTLLRSRSYIASAGLMLLLFASSARTQETETQTETQTKIKKVPAKQTSAASGEEMYHSYCASCHGATGKGDGPAAPALKGPVPDLTMLAKQNGGKYPEARVMGVLRFGTGNVPAHGSPEMPIWGPILGSLGGGQGQASAIVHLRITNLTNYLGTLQVK